MSKILIVDDDVASCRTLQLHLQTRRDRAQRRRGADTGAAQGT